MSRVGPREPGIVGLATRRSIADVIWVANTRHGPGGHWFARVTRDDGDHDHLRTAAEAVRYLADHGVDVPDEPPTADDLAGLAAIREMVRGLRDPAAGWTDAALRLLERARFGLDRSAGSRASPRAGAASSTIWCRPCSRSSGSATASRSAATRTAGSSSSTRRATARGAGATTPAAATGPASSATAPRTAQALSTAVSH